MLKSRFCLLDWRKTIDLGVIRNPRGFALKKGWLKRLFPGHLDVQVLSG